MNERMVARRLDGLVGELCELSSHVGDDADRIDVIAALEKLKAATAAAQLSVVADFAASQEAANRALGVEARSARRGVPEQVGLARTVAPATAARQVTQAKALRDDLPATFALLSAGDVSEWVATIVVTETSHLAAEDRQLVDKKLAPELPELSPRRAQARVRVLGYEVDPAGAVKRAANARTDRRVGIRPAPDTMAMLSALLPCEQGVAAWAALRRHSDTVIAADTARTIAEGATTSHPADTTEPARLWIRRLFADPVTGIIVDCDPRRRRFTGTLAKLLRYRDHTCRDPYCDAPIRHLDHIQPHADGGPTTPTNGRGLCERGNYVNQMPGWHSEVIDPAGHTIETTTPTGHTYRSSPPPAPGTHRQPAPT